MGKNVRSALFNDAINTFYLRLYGVEHMVKYNIMKAEKCWRHTFRLASMDNIKYTIN